MAAEKDIDTSAELERLRAENAALRQQVEEAEKTSLGRSAKWRNGGAAAIMLVATLLLALAIPAVWVNRMVTSTDYYVATVAPLARDTAIQDAIADSASDAIVEQLDLETRLDKRLPEDLAFLAAPISSAADGFIRKQATAFVRSDAFLKVWDETNRVGHQAFVTAVTGKDTGAVQVEAGTITLDTGVLIDRLVAELSDRGFEFVENLPTAALDKTMTIYQSDALAQATTLVDQIQRIALILPILGFALTAGAIALAADRRRIMLWLGWSLLIWTLVPLQFIYIGQTYVGRQLESLASIPTEAAQNAYAIIFSALIASEQLFVAVSVLIIVAALLAGKSRWATAFRRGMSGGIAGVSAHLNLGVFGQWVGQRMPALRVVGYVLAGALLVVLPRPRTMTQVWWIVGLTVVWVLLVQLFGSGSADGPPPLEAADEPDADEEPTGGSAGEAEV